MFNAADKPLAAIKCLPIDYQSKTPDFYRQSLQELDCGVSLSNLGTTFTPKKLSNLEVLTSRPGLLNKQDIEIAVTYLSIYKMELDRKVRQ